MARNLKTQIEANGLLLVFIPVNLKWTRERDKFKSITKAITLPKWLNQKAIESGINVSAVTQKALTEALNLEEPKVKSSCRFFRTALFYIVISEQNLQDDSSNLICFITKIRLLRSRRVKT